MEVVKECLKLDPCSPSGLRWAKSSKARFNSNIGKPAGYRNSQGYYKVVVLGVEYPCHQLVLWLSGIEPTEGFTEVDHIDRNPSNNLVSNLRWTNRSGNIRNRRVKGILGWRFTSPARPSGKRVRAQYKSPVTRLKVHVGTFDDPYEAHLSAIVHRLENHWIN